MNTTPKITVPQHFAMSIPHLSSIMREARVVDQIHSVSANRDPDQWLGELIKRKG